MSDPADQADRLGGLLRVHGETQTALLPLLHALQEERGFIAEEDVRALAGALNLSRAEVHGVLSFYSDFRTAPEPRLVVQLCRAEACQARGVDALVQALPADFAERAALRDVYCLGLCSVGPAALVGGQAHARLDAGRLAALVREAQ